MSKAKNLTLIFDFDGTICDSFIATLRIMNELASVFRYNTVAESEFETLKDQDLSALKNTLNISTYKVPFVMHFGRKRMLSRIVGLNPIEGLPAILAELKSNGYTLGILSSNSKQNVDLFLRHHNLQIFDFVHGESSLWGKARVLRKILKNNKLEASRAAYIGDEARDLHAARAAKMNSIGVAWGFNSERLLSAAKPDVILKKPEELLIHAKKLSQQ